MRLFCWLFGHSFRHVADLPAIHFYEVHEETGYPCGGIRVPELHQCERCMRVIREVR